MVRSNQNFDYVGLFGVQQQIDGISVAFSTTYTAMPPTVFSERFTIIITRIFVAFSNDLGGVYGMKAASMQERRSFGTRPKFWLVGLFKVQ